MISSGHPDCGCIHFKSLAATKMRNIRGFLFNSSCFYEKLSDIKVNTQKRHRMLHNATTVLNTAFLFVFSPDTTLSLDWRWYNKVFVIFSKLWFNAHHPDMTELSYTETHVMILANLMPNGKRHFWTHINIGFKCCWKDIRISNRLLLKLKKIWLKYNYIWIYRL